MAQAGQIRGSRHALFSMPDLLVQLRTRIKLPQSVWFQMDLRYPVQLEEKTLH